MIEAALTTIALATLANYIRGGNLHAYGVRGDKWIGTGLIAVASFIAFETESGTAEGIVALSWALAFLVWQALPWGHWFHLGEFVKQEPRTGFEWTVEHWSGGEFRQRPGNPYLAMLWRHGLFGFVPALVVVMLALAWLGARQAAFIAGAITPVAAVLTIAAYEAGKRLDKPRMIPIAEALVGVLWGVLILIINGSADA